MRSFDFLLNGIKEEIICFPINESDSIEFTMGGKREFSTKTTFEHFRLLTGIDFKALSGASLSEECDMLNELERALVGAGMSMKRTSGIGDVISAEAGFVNRAGSEFKTIYHLYKDDNKYTFNISKLLKGLGAKYYKMHSSSFSSTDLYEVSNQSIIRLSELNKKAS